MGGWCVSRNHQLFVYEQINGLLNETCSVHSSLIVFLNIHISAQCYLGFRLRMKKCCTQGLKAQFKTLLKNVDVFAHVVFTFLCVVDLAQGLGANAAWQRQKLQSKLLWSAADFIDTSRWRGDELRASWRFSKNWEVTLYRYKDDLSRTKARQTDAELPIYVPHGVHAIRGKWKGITDGNVDNTVSFSSYTRANLEAACMWCPHFHFIC